MRELPEVTYSEEDRVKLLSLITLLNLLGDEYLATILTVKLGSLKSTLLSCGAIVSTTNLGDSEGEVVTYLIDDDALHLIKCHDINTSREDLISFHDKYCIENDHIKHGDLVPGCECNKPINIEPSPVKEEDIVH